MSDQYIACPRQGCEGKIAVIRGKDLIEIRRSKQKFQIFGGNYNLICTCPYHKCEILVTIHVKDGEIVNRDTLTIKDFVKSSVHQQDKVRGQGEQDDMGYDGKSGLNKVSDKIEND